MGWLTWAIIIVVALAAFFLIVFLVKRIKKAEKETEDEWSLTQRSIFTNAVPPPTDYVEPAPTRTAELENSMPAPSQFPGPIPRPTGETKSLTSSKEAGETARTELLRSVPAVEPEPPEVAPPKEEPTPAPEPPPTFGQRYQPPPRPDGEQQQGERGTELLASRGPERAENRAKPPRATTPFDQKAWEGLEKAEQPAERPPAPVEPTGEARVDSRRLEMFEPPVIEPMKRRESFEPPVIEPLESPEEPPAARPKAVESRPVVVDRELRQHVTPQSVTPQPVTPHEVVAAGPPVRASEHRSGSVLNLPAEYSDAPMVYGEVSPERQTRAIGSLSNYGKHDDDKKGRGWKWLLALAGVAVAIVLMYFFIRPVNERVDRWFEAVRGRNLAASKPPPAPEYKAQVLLTRAQLSNNNALAKARGRVINTSDAPLENLSVEVELIRKDGAPPDIRTAPVNPATLAPTQQGIFELDLDSRVYSGHKLRNLFSKDGEVPFSAPGQTKQQPQSSPPQ